MYCNNCGTKIPDDAVFCENCGKRVARPINTPVNMTPPAVTPPVENAAGTEQPVQTPTVEQPAKTPTVEQPAKAPTVEQPAKTPAVEQPVPAADSNAPKPKKKKGLIIGIVSGVAVLVIAAAVIITLGLIKTNKFRDQLAEYDTRASQMSSLGRYEDDYSALKEEAETTAGKYQFWKYSDYPERFDAILSEAEALNREVDRLRSDYDSFTSGMRSSGLSLGTFQSEYDRYLYELQNALGDYDEEKAKKYLEDLAALRSRIEQMNIKIAEWRTKRDEQVRRLSEYDYVLLEYADEYNDDLTAANSDIDRFDENAAASSVEKLEDVISRIIKANEDFADYCSSYADQTKKKVNKSGKYLAFEKYKTELLSNEVVRLAQEKQYSQLEQCVGELDNWINGLDELSSMNSSGRSEIIDSWVQADVSEKNLVKLYIKTSKDSDYHFMIEDFEIWERDGNVWDECKAQDISQIAGAMSLDIVADISGSMQWYDNFYNMQLAIENFVNQTSSDTYLGLSTIGTIYERYQNMTTDKNSIINSVWSLNCYGLTSLYQSLYSSVVYTAGCKGSRCVVAFTDGINEPYGVGYDFDADDVINVSKYYQVPVYIIGIGSGVDRNTLQYIAESTGGKYYDSAYASQLATIYSDIYQEQGKLYQLSYMTKIENDKNREVYVHYKDDQNVEAIRFEATLDAETLQEAYETAGLDPNDLTSFFSETRALSTDDLFRLGDNLENVQTIINIYFAKYGYKFSNQEILKKMINLGVISSNGTLSGSAAEEKMKKDALVYQNYSAMFNYRYELIYKVALQLYTNNPSITYDNMRIAIHQYYNEPNQNRYSDATRAAWNALHHD